MALASCSTIVVAREALSLPPGFVALSFDDGPNPDQDTKLMLLAALERQGIKAFFCIVGERVKEAPDLVRAIAEGGHAIVNHGYAHSFPLFASRDELLSDAAACDAEIGRALGIEGYRASWYRPPKGIVTSATRAMMEERGYRLLPISLFSVFHVDSEFLPSGGAEAFGFALREAIKQGGGMLVFHDGNNRGFPPDPAGYAGQESLMNRGWVPGAVEGFIQACRKAGLRFFDADRFDLSGAYFE